MLNKNIDIGNPMDNLESQTDSHLPKTPTFFQTEAVREKQRALPQKITDHKVHSYINSLNSRIENALSHQNNAISRRKLKLHSELETVREEIAKKTEKMRKMDQFFKIHCENILKNDIVKQDGNKGFFTQLFQYYTHQLQTMQAQNHAMRQEIKSKKKHLKDILKQKKNNYYETRVQKIMMEKGLYQDDTLTNQSVLSTSKKSESLARLQTEITLPSLTKAQRNILLSAQLNNVKPLEFNTNFKKSRNRMKTFEGEDPHKELQRNHRIQTENNITKQQERQNRYGQEGEAEEKNFMRPLLKTEILLQKMKKDKSIENSEKDQSFYRNSSNPESLENLLNVLSWYKQEKFRRGDHNWFEKVVFLDRNYWKVEQYLRSALETTKIKGKKLHIGSKTSMHAKNTERGDIKPSPNLNKKSLSYQKLKN